jgi:5-deoxy-5-amino-3-dehydroquinate synthase
VGAPGELRVLLVGMMGAGKTTVGRLLAQRLGWDFADSDSQVEAATGRTVPQLLVEEGEPAFRAAESDALRAALGPRGPRGPRVVSVAGGAVLDPVNRALLRTSGTVVWLRAQPATLAARVGTGRDRPLLGDDPPAALARLDAVRRPLYEEVAGVVVDVDGLDPTSVVDRVLAVLPGAGPPPAVPPDPPDPPPPVITVPVELGDRRYDVLVGDGVRRQLAAVIAGRVPGPVGRAAVVTQAAVAEAGWLRGLDPGVPFDIVEVPDGEIAKSLLMVEHLCREFAARGLARTDVIVAVGGGVVTDVAGFAAAVYHRGIPYVSIATSLLAQVDAAIGGKTGVNLAEGKNLVGAFWQPSAVLCDTETLSTLPPREWACGRGEMAKYAFLSAGTDLPDLPLIEQVARCVSLKAAVVAADEREGGRRALLNYGHTLAHALEASALAGIRHGEAVAVGLVFAALLARRLGRIDDARVELHRRVLAGFGLVAELPPGARAPELLGSMARDKKARHDLTFVLDGPDGLEVVRGVDPAAVLATLADMGAGT